MTIVGVVSDVKNQGVTSESRQEMYVPLRQQTSVGGGFRSMALAIRTTVDPLSLAGSVRQTVWALDRNIPISNVQTMQEVIATQVVQQRFNAALLGVFALVALVLSTAGIYSVISYSVARRTREIGVRMALGAQTGDVLKLVIRKGMLLALIGIAGGLAASLVLTRVMQSMLFEVSASDPATFLGVAVLLALVALLACYLPARRATKVDPITALRYE
jgi:putative ABC transport system permease protein